MRKPLFLWIAALGFCASCSQKEQASISTFTLFRDTFSEIISGYGTLQSSNNVNITVPMLRVGDLTNSWIIEEGLTVQQGDTVCILESKQLHLMKEDAILDIEKSEAELEKQEASDLVLTQQFELQLKENDLRLSMIELDSVQLKFANPAERRLQELELKKAQIMDRKIRKSLNSQKRISEQTIRALKSQLQQKQNNLQQINEQIGQLTITAPKDGMVVYASSGRYVVYGAGELVMQTGVEPGAQVYPRMPLLQLPDVYKMHAVMMVLEHDFKKIEKGQKVLIQSEAGPRLETTGTVESKSLNSQPLAYQFKVKSYKVVIDIDSLDEQFKPGLSAICQIILHEIKDTLVVPSIAIFERDSHKIVYVADGDLFVADTVITGTANATQTIVSGGLLGNESIALTEPPASLIKKPKNKTHE